MADFVFNAAKGRGRYFAGLPAANDALIAVLCKSAGLETDATLKDYANLSLLLAGTTDECDATGYVRKTLTNVTVTVDNTNDWVTIDCDDIVWSSLGGATNNVIGKLLVCYDDDTTSGNDTNLIPFTAHDLVVTTDGTTFTATVADFYRAS